MITSIRHFISERVYDVVKGVNNTQINYTYGGVSDDGIGEFYTDNMTMAKWFAGLLEYDSDEGEYVAKDNDGRVINKRITLDNPYVIDIIDDDYGNDSVQLYFSEIRSAGSASKYREKLVDAGHDGIILKNYTTNYYDYPNTYTVYIVF